MKLIAIDFKRVFAGWGTVLLCVLAPFCVMLTLSLVAMPMFATTKLTKFSAMLCDEDGSEPVRQFITQLVNSQALKDLIAVYPVATPDKGMELLKSGDATIFIHIPPHMFDDMSQKRHVQLDIYAAPGHELEVAVVRSALSDSLAAVGKSENILELAYWSVRGAGVPQKQSDDFFSKTMDYAINQYMSRREVFGDMGVITPLGDLVPVQYYLAAVYTLFSALAALPLSRKTANDLNGTLLRRGVLAGHNASRFFFARILSGMAFILLILLTLIPTGSLFNIANFMRSARLVGSVPAMLFAMLLISCCFSAFAAALPLAARNKDTAGWAGFFVILLLACCSGLFIPENLLPDAVRSAARVLPLSASMHLLSGTLFRFDAAAFWRDAGVLSVWCALLLCAGYFTYRRKERAA